MNLNFALIFIFPGQENIACYGYTTITTASPEMLKKKNITLNLYLKNEKAWTVKLMVLDFTDDGCIDYGWKLSKTAMWLKNRLDIWRKFEIKILTDL